MDEYDLGKLTLAQVRALYRAVSRAWGEQPENTDYQSLYWLLHDTLTGENND